MGAPVELCYGVLDRTRHLVDYQLALAARCLALEHGGGRFDIIGIYVLQACSSSNDLDSELFMLLASRKQGLQTRVI